MAVFLWVKVKYYLTLKKNFFPFPINFSEHDNGLPLKEIKGKERAERPTNCRYSAFTYLNVALVVLKFY